MAQLHRTVLYDRHVKLGAKIVEFGGWEMPIQYPSGIVQEHLATRKGAGAFDVSHMGRLIFKGADAPAFLQHVLSNNAAALEVGQSQYTIIPNDAGGAIDDAYLYRFLKDEYLLVVNASNREKDWAYFQQMIKKFPQVQMTDRTEELAMISLQGPLSKDILSGIISGHLPDPMRNALSIVSINGKKVLAGRTGYTGEPICFELFINRDDAPPVWDMLIEKGATPVGLGARDTLRLEAALPLYGHEFGIDAEGKEIPIFTCPLAKFAVSFSPLKGNFVGREALSRQFEALKKIKNCDYTTIKDLPRLVMPVAVAGKGIARAGSKIFKDEKIVGFVTSGTMVPCWKWEGQGLSAKPTDQKDLRSICLALLDSTLRDGDKLEIEIRDKRTEALIVPYHLRSEAPPYARPIVYDQLSAGKTKAALDENTARKVQTLLEKAIANTLWRQTECINLIPSEQTESVMTRILSTMDPAGRYAEHKSMKAFSEAEVFYYQGTDFIAEVEKLLEEELRLYLGCREIESRLISGQMANTAVFSAMVDHLNLNDRKSEQRRIRRILNHHIMRGGHLSAQPMGALRDYVARDPVTEKPAVVNFPVLRDNPYMIDVVACKEIIAEYKPELIIFGKSLILHREPVAQIRKFVDEISLDCVIMYDMAHVLGLVGPYFQQPFEEGAEIVTGSTHKTFFGTQRGVVAANYKPEDVKWPLWEALRRRAFPGSVSNHHLGTMLGLLMATYEMNYFKDEYQPKVINNAKAFAVALKETGMDVAGDPAINYTETHQVVLNVGYGKGPEIARRLEENNIIVNYQASPTEEGFTASGSLRMGVSEMTRFGMEEKDFKDIAQLIYDAVVKQKNVREQVSNFRKRFTDMRYCFSEQDFGKAMKKLYKLI
jgi:aminomethyltransferase